MENLKPVDKKQSSNDISTMFFGIFGLLVILVGGFFLIKFLFFRDNSDSIYTKEHLNQMLHEDPSTWTKQERDYFEGYFEYIDNQDDD